MKKDMKSKEVISKIQMMTLLSKPFVFKTTERENLKFSKSVITIDSNSVSVDEIEDEDIISDQELNSYILKKGSKELTQREQLLSNVWGYDFYGDDRTIDTHVKTLRNNLGEYRRFIVTVRGMGYKFEYKDEKK